MTKVPLLITVARVGDLGPGEMMRVVARGEPILLANVDGQYYAAVDECTHELTPLSEGWLEDHEVECPRHGARFDLITGAVRAFPATEPLQTYPVVVENDEIKVQLHETGG